MAIDPVLVRWAAKAKACRPASADDVEGQRRTIARHGVDRYVRNDHRDDGADDEAAMDLREMQCLPRALPDARGGGDQFIEGFLKGRDGGAAAEVGSLLSGLLVFGDVRDFGKAVSNRDPGAAALAALGVVPAGEVAHGLRVSERMVKAGVPVIQHLDEFGRVVQRAPRYRVFDATAEFTTREFEVGDHTLTLTREKLIHVLQRHHPRYWEGTTKTAQSFFEAGTKITDIEHGVAEVLRQNARRLEGELPTRLTLHGQVGGRTWVVGITNGRIGQVYAR